MMKKAKMKRRSFVKPLNKLVKSSHSRFVEKRPGDSKEQFFSSSCEVGSFTVNEYISEKVLII